MLQERDQRRRDRNDLRRRHVHELDLVRGREHELVARPARDQLVLQPSRLVELRVRLRDHVLPFLDRRQIVNLVGDLAVDDLAVRRFQEAVFVGARVERQRVDETDVRAFRRLDRAYPAVVRRVHVAHFEARALAREPAGAQSRDAPLVRNLGQRVGLVHELGQLRRPEELLDRGRNRLGVDQVVGQQILALSLAEALLDRALDAHQSRAELVFRQLAHRAHAPVPEVIDVVDLAAAVAQLDEDLDDRDDVIVGERPCSRQLAAADATIELHPSDRRQVVTLFREEQAVEQRLDRFLGRGLAGAHHAIDRDPSRGLVRRIVELERLRDIRPLIEVIDIDRMDLGDAGLDQLGQQLVGYLIVGRGENLTRILVDHGLGQRAAGDVVVGHGDLLDAGVGQLANMARRDPLVLLHQNLAVLAHQIELGDFAAQALGHEVHVRALLRQIERVEGKKPLEDVLVGQPDRLQQRRHRHLAAAVDAEVEVVLRIELEIEPRAAIRDHARREQELAGRMRLAAIVLEEHSRTAVQLRHDDPFGAVDDERAVAGHERYLAHVNFLLLDLLHRFLGRFLVHDDQAHLGAQRRAVRQPALLAFGDVERRRQQRIADEFQPRIARVTGDREDRRERGLQAFVLARFQRRRCLQERTVRCELGFQQERDRQHACALGEALANALFLGKRVLSHGS